MRKSLFICLCCLIPIWQYVYAESTESGYDDSEEVFEYVDLEQVPTGILADYGIHLVDPELYDGIETNFVNPFVWKSLYAGLQSSIVNSKCVMEESNDVFDFLSENNALGIMYYKYNTFAEDALERGLVTFEDEKIRIVPGMPSPYVEKECFAVMPTENSLPTALNKCILYTNTGLDITKLEAKIGNGNYSVIYPYDGLAVRVPTNTPGEYDITFRVTFSNGKTMESHSIVSIEGSATSFPPGFTSDSNGVVDWETIDADYSQSGGKIQVKYMNNTPAKGKFIRPLILVEDMDLSVLSSSLKMNLDSLISQDGGVGDAIDQLSQLYDIIYIDFNDGLDDLLRNAEMLRKALKEINGNRYSVSGHSVSDESYIVGLGTGGVLARIAVNMMEKANEDHKVQKIVSVNSPFRGINIPLALQMFLHQGEAFANDISSHKHFEFAKGIFDPYINFLNRRAIRQLMMYCIVNYDINNTEHISFLQNEDLLKRPNNCKSVVVSNGNNHNYNLYSPYYKIMDIDYEHKEGLGKVWSGGAEIIVAAFSTPEKRTAEIYNGAMRRFKIRCGVKKNFDQNYKILNSTSDMYSVDNASGTLLETVLINNFVSALPNFGKVMQVNNFCFVPTFSALDLDADKYFAADDLEDLRGEMNADRAYWTGRNDSYPGLSGIVDILMQELAPTIKGETRNVLGDIVLTADNFINLPLGIKYDWKFRNGKFKVVSQNGAEAVVRPLEYSGAKDYVSVTATPTVDIPGLSGMKVTFPEREITSEKIEIEGLESISRMDNYYALSALPSDGCTVDWTCSSGLRVEKTMEEAALAHVEEFSDDAWIEATLHHGDTDYKFHKDLICARIDSIRFSLEQKVWNRTSKSYKYGFRIKLYPEDIDLELIDFCWDNSVHIYNKSDGSRVDSARPGSMLRGSYGGIASIKTDGDVAPCSMKLDDWHDTIMVIDTIAILNPYPGIGIDYGGVHPTSVVEPGGDPIGLDDIVMYGKNCAVVTMPGVSSEEYAAGDIICDITDDFGTKYHVTYTMQSSWTPVYNCSVSPNPAGERLDVRMTVEGDPAAVTADEPVTALLYSDTGLVAKETFADIREGGSLDVSHLPEGTYYLNIEVNGTVVDRQVVLIQR